jgi:hypothetical protein
MEVPRAGSVEFIIKQQGDGRNTWHSLRLLKSPLSQCSCMYIRIYDKFGVDATVLSVVLLYRPIRKPDYGPSIREESVLEPEVHTVSQFFISAAILHSLQRWVKSWRMEARLVNMKI